MKGNTTEKSLEKIITNSPLCQQGTEVNRLSNKIAGCNPAINNGRRIRPESNIMYKHYSKNHAKSPDSEKLSLQQFITLIETKTSCKAKLSYNGYQLHCPAHRDKRASLSVTQDESGKILFNCHAGCQFKDICWTLNIKPQQLFPQSN